jgi:putative ABC transport system substrate-binding protein
VRALFALAAVLATGSLAAPLPALSQPTALVRVGWLNIGSPAQNRAPLEAFRQGLRELGYVEGRDLVIEERWADNEPGRLPALAADLVRRKVDVIVTGGDEPVRAARQATGTIPIVMGVSGDPVGAGFVASLARPGGNVTGLSFLSPELSAKQLELLKEAVPGLSRVAVLWNAANPAKSLDLAQAERSARALGLSLQPAEVRSARDFDAAFGAIGRQRPDALLVLIDELLNQPENIRRIGALALKHRLPAISGDRRHVEAGALISYGPSVPESFRRAAAYVVKILKGASAGALPVEQPTRFELVVSLRTARVLGVALPPAVLLRADHVVE